MTQKPKQQMTETFQVVGVAQEGRTAQNIYEDIEGLKGNLLKADSAKGAAEAIMHMCADIIVMSKTMKA